MIFEPAIDQQDELNRQYSSIEFTTIISQLINSLDISYQKGNDIQQTKIYEQIYQRKGKVTGQDIVETIQQLKQNNFENVAYKDNLEKQISVYRVKIRQLARKGIGCLSMLEYYEVFPKQGLIADQLTKYINKLDYVSLEKLTKVIDSIEEINQGSGTMKSQLKVSSLQKSNIFDQAQIDQHSQIQISSLIQYINDNILDSGIRKNLQTFLSKTQQKLQSLTESLSQKSQTEQSLRTTLQQLDNQLFQSYKQHDMKDNKIHKLQDKIRKQQQEIQIQNIRYQNDVINNLQILEEENQRFRKEVSLYVVRGEEMEGKLRWFKENYQGLVREYEKFVREKEEAEGREKKNKQERIFTQRTVKQQLQDAQGKISRLRQQNLQLRNKASDMTYSYQNKISVLQQKLKELEQAHQSNQLNVLHIENSKIRNSYLNYRSKISSSNFTIRGSHVSRVDDNETTSKLEVPQSDDIYRSSVTVFSSIIKEKDQKKQDLMFKKKKEVISIRAASIMTLEDDEEDKGQVQEKKDKKEEQKKMKKQKPNLNMTLPTKKKVEQSSSQKKSKQEGALVNFQQSKRKKLFTTPCFFLNLQGSRYPAYLILSQDRFSFLDSKNRPNYSVKFTQIRKIIFCYNNSTWLVLKLKSQQRNQKNQLLTDIVLSTFNRSDILQYIQQRCANKLCENGVKIGFEKEEEIWVSGQQSENILSHYQNYYNLNRISINSAGHIFQATVKSNSLFNFQDDVLLIVSNIGILVFDTDGEYYLERSQKLLYIIPLVQNMEISLASEHRIELKFPSDKKLVYRIRLASSAAAKRLKKLIEDYKRSITDGKMKELEKYSILTSILNRSQGGQVMGMKLRF